MKNLKSTRAIVNFVLYPFLKYKEVCGVLFEVSLRKVLPKMNLKARNVCEYSF